MKFHPAPADRYPFTVRAAFENLSQEPVPEIRGTVIKSWVPFIAPGGNMGKVAGYGQDNLVRPFWDRPAPTVRKDAALTGYGCFLHPDGKKLMSSGEYRRLGSFPDEFRFSGSYIDIKNRIGNSVPPLFMQSIARCIRNQLTGFVSAASVA